MSNPPVCPVCRMFVEPEQEQVQPVEASTDPRLPKIVFHKICHDKIYTK